MTKYREILRLKSLGFSGRNTALSVPCSRNTVSKVLKRTEEKGVSWPLSDETTDADFRKDAIVICTICIHKADAGLFIPTSGRNF